jgi:hypothetical protein
MIETVMPDPQTSMTEEEAMTKTIMVEAMTTTIDLDMMTTKTLEAWIQEEAMIEMTDLEEETTLEEVETAMEAVETAMEEEETMALEEEILTTGDMNLETTLEPCRQVLIEDKYLH